MYVHRHLTQLGGLYVYVCRHVTVGGWIVCVCLQTSHYRFSISWSRILPDGTKEGGVNKAGVDYYNRLINGLLAAGVQPFVTLYHWDLPQPLQDIGGWTNEKLAQRFNDYATVCYEEFGDRVSLFI